MEDPLDARIERVLFCVQGNRGSVQTRGVSSSSHPAIAARSVETPIKEPESCHSPTFSVLTRDAACEESRHRTHTLGTTTQDAHTGHRYGLSRLNSKRRGVPPLVKPIVALRPPSAETSYTMRFG